MAPCQDPLDRFRDLDAEYRVAAEKAAEILRQRDQALLEAAKDRTVRTLAAKLGLSPGRVQQLLARARKGTTGSTGGP